MTEFLNYLLSGVARGSLYALVALGFVIIFRATHVLNFAQGSIMALGAYLTYWLSGPVPGLNFKPAPHIAKLPYWVAVILSVVLTALFGWFLEAIVIRRFRGRPVFAVIMATLGVGIIMDQTCQAIWGTSVLKLRDPFALKLVRVGGVSIKVVDLVTLGLALVAMLVFFVFFRRSRIGTAMRATAFDQEAAIAQGISANFVFGLSWAISAGLAALAGIMLSSGGDRSVSTALPLFALAGFPAIVLGGIDSVEGAILGGLVIGIAEQLTAGYQTNIEQWVGFDFYIVMPFVLMIVILLVRPSGFFGTREVRRV